ncbi:MAG: hypothetical protein CR989_04875 [Flavobacteriales bacterium]|nr:MAG: hypothetical protein CR989_04875 [Flavobacteriales bacterium]
MKTPIFILLIFVALSCSNSDDNNPNLPDVAVNKTLYLNNPSNNNLLFAGGYVEINGGIKGIVVYRGNNDTFYAYDLACPHLAVDSCDKMIIEDGIFLVCTCDNTKFALALGGAPQSDTKYAAKAYNVIQEGKKLIITNY